MKNFFLYKIPIALYLIAAILDLIIKNYASALKNFLIAFLFFQIILEKNKYRKLNSKVKSPKDYLEEIKEVTNQSFQKPIVNIDCQKTNVISFRLKNETNKKIENITFLDLTKRYFTNNYKSKEVQIEVIQSNSKGHFLDFLKDIQELKNNYPIKKILVISKNPLNTWINYIVYNKDCEKNKMIISIDSIIKGEEGLCEVIPHKEVILDNASKLDLLFILPNSEIDIYIEY